MKRLTFLLWFLTLPHLHAADPKPPETNILFRGVTVHDGSGKEGYISDVHILGDKIVAVGKIEKPVGAKEINAKGLVLCPGFIDLHTHCDTGSVAFTSKAGRPNKNYVTQGCTTVITGNCGSGPVDTADFFQKLEDGGTGTNVIHLAPHNSIRDKVMGNANRVPTAEEQKKMEELVEKAMKDGAWGMATGLIYNPGTYAKTEEIIGLAKVVGKYHGLYASHIRNESAGLLTAIEEAIKIGKESNCPVHISHIKASGQNSWGASAKAVALIEGARKAGHTVTADQYPYIASSTSLKATLVSARWREGTQKEYLARFDDPKTGPQIKADIEKALEGRAGGKRIQIARYAPNPKWQGQNIAAIAEAEKKEPIDIVLEIEKNGGAAIVNFGMSEEDVRVYMKQSWVATASDGSIQSPGDTVPHPRSYGTFPRKIGKYAIEDGIITLEQAIRSSSGLPADILKLKNRGYIKEGYIADVVVFDPNKFRDTATYDKPHQYATGLLWVFVNGVPEVVDGKHDDKALGGRVLRHEAR